MRYKAGIRRIIGVYRKKINDLVEIFHDVRRGFFSTKIFSKKSLENELGNIILSDRKMQHVINTNKIDLKEINSLCTVSAEEEGQNVYIILSLLLQSMADDTYELDKFHTIPKLSNYILIFVSLENILIGTSTAQKRNYIVLDRNAEKNVKFIIIPISAMKLMKFT